MTRSWLSALTLIVVAAGLFVGLTHFGQEVDTFYRDHPSHFTYTRSSTDYLILPMGGSFSTPNCAARSPCKVLMVETINGLFARGRNRFDTARIGGVAMPILLLSVAGYLALSKLRGAWHVIAAVPLLTGGLILLLPLVGIVYLDSHYPQYTPTVSLLDALISPLLLSTIAASGMLLSCVVWVGIDTFRGHQNKQ